MRSKKILVCLAVASVVFISFLGNNGYAIEYENGQNDGFTSQKSNEIKNQKQFLEFLFAGSSIVVIVLITTIIVARNKKNSHGKKTNSVRKK